MNARKWQRRSFLIFTINVALLAVGVGTWFPEMPPALAKYASAIHLLGAVLTWGSAVGVSVATGMWLVLLMFAIKERAETTVAVALATHLDARPIKDSDLDEVSRLGKEVAGPTFSGPEVLHDRLNRNPRYMVAIVDEADAHHLHGVHLAYPLTQDAHIKIQMGVIESSSELKVDHICPPQRPPKAIYISLVHADGFRSRGYVLNSVRRDVTHAVARHASIETVYARPVSARGRALLKDAGFVPVRKEAGIWERRLH